MSWTRLVRSELRKLTTTRMPWAFLAVLVVLAVLNALAVAFGTDMDGSKAFIATAADQQSLIAFAANGFMGAGLFGAVAVAREYGHNTVVPTYLATPRRPRAVLAQDVAVAIGGAGLSFVGAGLTIIAVALALPVTDYGFLVSAGTVGRILAASTLFGAAGAVFGAGLGAIVRNTGGALAGAFLALIVAPPLAIQLVSDSASWVPSTLGGVVSGTAGDVGVPVAVVAIIAWAVIPASLGLWSVQSRDVI